MALKLVDDDTEKVEKKRCTSHCKKLRPETDFYPVAKGSERRSNRCRYCAAYDQRQLRARRKKAKARAAKSKSAA
jgi:hypothetical protein